MLVKPRESRLVSLRRTCGTSRSRGVLLSDSDALLPPFDAEDVEVVQMSSESEASACSRRAGAGPGRSSLAPPPRVGGGVLGGKSGMGVVDSYDVSSLDMLMASRAAKRCGAYVRCPIKGQAGAEGVEVEQCEGVEDERSKRGRWEIGLASVKPPTTAHPPKGRILSGPSPTISVATSSLVSVLFADD